MKILMALAVFLCGCSFDPPKFDLSPPPDPAAENKKAHDEFLQLPIAKEFAEAGVPLDCELAICAKISPESLTTLQKYKSQFVHKAERIKKIHLVKEDYPIYDYRLEWAALPAQISDSLLGEFFEVLDSIRGFEDQVGFRVEFPNTRHLKLNVLPLLQILENNTETIKAENRRIELLVVGVTYSRFRPAEKFLHLRISDLKNSFTDLWSFIALLFDAQDLFGSVHFDLDRREPANVSTLKLLVRRSATFKPYLNQLQGRSILLFPTLFYSYNDAWSSLEDLGISSSFDENYLVETFRDQIRVLQISEYIGKRIFHVEATIELNGHGECLDKIAAIKRTIRGKSEQIEFIVVAHGDHFPGPPSSFYSGELYLNCTQSSDELKAVVDAI